MLPASGAALPRAALVVPVILLVIFAGLLGPVGLLLSRERREYVEGLIRLMLAAARDLIHGPSVVRPARDDTPKVPGKA